jgi:plastocyanin domain-containing protein
MRLLINTLVLAALATSHFAGGSLAASKASEQKIALAVTSNGFEPATINVRAGRPVRLIITRRVERTCATAIVLKDYGVKRTLPLNQPVEVRFTPKKAGAIRYACGMDMIAGRLVVR